MLVLYFDIAIWVSYIYEYHGVTRKCDYACSFYVTKLGWFPVSVHIDVHVYLELSIPFCQWILEWGKAGCLFSWSSVIGLSEVEALWHAAHPSGEEENQKQRALQASVHALMKEK